LPEVDQVAAFGVPVTLGRTKRASSVPSLDLLELPRPPATAPWAYVKVAEGCDRACGFCAIPSFRGPQRSRTAHSVLGEVDALVAGGAKEIVLVAQDLAAYGRDREGGPEQDERRIIPLVEAAAERAERVRLLYLYPSDLTDALVEAILATGVPYFDLSLQHVSRPLVRRMRRWGDGARFLERIQRIRALEPTATLRSSFIVGYPGETEADHDAMLAFLHEAQLDWVGLFSYSSEEGTYAAELDGAVPKALVRERMAELSEVQEPITAAARDALVGQTIEVLVDAPGVARSHREAPEIDGIVRVADDLGVGDTVKVQVTASLGVDVEAVAS
jgi:ribosomal protein S12 methylthiotransferase